MMRGKSVRLVRWRLCLVLLLALAGLPASGGSAAAAALPPYLSLEAGYGAGIVTGGWERVERYLDTTSGFRTEGFPPDGRGDQDGKRVTYFGGTTRPYSGRFLLYSAPGWNTGSRPTPVLLVHGANDSADRAWADPGEAGGYGCGAASCPSTGLMQYLAGRGHRVFALGFAHKQGDNLMQAQTVGDAIAVIRAKLGVSQVDLVGWSKGMMSTRAYVSSLKPTWGRPYAGDVRRLVTLGGPNGGYDYPYAHGWAHDFSIWPECGGKVNAPSPHSHMTCYGLYTAHPEFSMTPAGVPAAVPTYLLAGGSADVLGIFNENRGPSDGVVFTSSALDTAGIPTVGGRATITGANHLELGWHSAATAQTAAWLS
ncbi:esterase/lipase family protein [Streptomyces polyrhachis]|uniref:Esterase/lipase family protein n=1 Tax=Streptomyces polyrhachis TaxID=1282885 RepID=A0ABW2GIP0_9ACTN